MNNYKREVTITYRDEQYLVRDNGAICRLRRSQGRKRQLDGVWTLGRQCRTHGYRKISGLPVHPIVATAFHGERPSFGHVVDHLDTNRRNNRAENLRWVTRLENITSNSKTLRRIEQKWGSVEAMLLDPDRDAKAEPLNNRSWMPQTEETAIHCQADVNSYTPLAIQRNWKTPNAFPLCPDMISDQSLQIYLRQLQPGAVFAHNKFGECMVEMAAVSEDGLLLSVISQICGGVKNWGLAKVSVENEKFVHEAQGTFFTLEGAEKRHCKLIGKTWNGRDSFDDYC